MASDNKHLRRIEWQTEVFDMMSKSREAAVWQRVMALSAEAPELPVQCREDDGLTQAQIMELLEHELADACTYRTLAQRAGGDLRRCLLQLAGEEQRHARKLEAVYYLMTGRKPCPDRPKSPCVACLNEELRRRYDAEIQGAAQYHKLADGAGSFAQTFHCLGLEEERHSRMILRLLEQCL